MKLLLILLLLLSFETIGQDSIPQPFNSKIIVYGGIGFDIPKTPKQRIVKHFGLRLEDRDSSYHINFASTPENFIVLGTVNGNDTIKVARYSFKFITIPDPKIRFDIQSDRYLDNIIKLHKDSLEELKKFTIQHKLDDELTLKWDVVKAYFYMSGIQGPPPILYKKTELTDEILNLLKQGGDTIQFSLTVNLRGQDGIVRQIGQSWKVYLLEGEAYARHLDPFYDFKRYVDTVYLSEAQLKASDTIRITNRGHLFLGFPKMKKSYEINVDDGYCHMGFGDAYMEIPKGTGFYIYDAYRPEGLHTIHVRSKENKHDFYLEIMTSDGIQRE